MRLGVLSALSKEQEYLIDQCYSKETIGGIDYVFGKIDETEVVFAISGIGKTNSAIATTVMITRFGCTNIIFVGVAGSLDNRLKIGDIVISTDVVCIDYGRRSDGKMFVYHPGNDPFSGASTEHGFKICNNLKDKIKLPRDIKLRKVNGHIPKVEWGRLLTADIFMDCNKTRNELNSVYKAQAFEMEGASVAQAAEKFNVKWIIIRALSDLAGEGSSLDFDIFIEKAAYNSNVITREIIKCMKV